VADYIKSHIKF